MADIDYLLISSHLLKDSKQIKTATRNTLNDLAFKAQKEITQESQSDMRFRKNAKLALGFRVRKASYSNMVAEIYSNRGWLYWHLNKGTRKPSSGLVFKGTRYILVPVEKAAFTKTKRLKKGYARNVYIVPDGGDALMFYRKRKSKQSILIATLERQVKYKEDIDPEKVVQDVMREHGLRILTTNLKRATRR